jgi:hypothetical protein
MWRLQAATQHGEGFQGSGSDCGVSVMTPAGTVVVGVVAVDLEPDGREVVDLA